MLEQGGAIKRLEYLPLGSELKKQRDIAKKHYHGLNKVHRFYNEVEEIINKKPALKSIKNQIYFAIIYLSLTNNMI